MTTHDEIIARDNAALFETEPAEPVTYRRPSTGMVRPFSVIIERGDLARDKDIRSDADARHKTGRAFLQVADLADFGGVAEYQDEIDADGETWKVMAEISRDAGIIEAGVERDIRPRF